MWGGGRRRRQQTIEASLEMARPYERMLDGSYLDAVCANGEAMPPWVWLNKLTHCAESELTLIASRPLAFANRPDLHGWARAVSFLAHELVRTSMRCGASIAALQREVLLPLELELMGAQFGPSELTRRVLVAIEETTRHRA